MGSDRTNAVTAWRLIRPFLGAWLATLGYVHTVGAADSGVEEAFPADFDPRHQYKAYGYDDLTQHLRNSFGITDTFVGERVKMLAFYDAAPVLASMRPNQLNRSKQFFASYGCRTDFCDRLEKPFGELATHDVFEDVPLYIHIRDPMRYDQFLKAAHGACSALHPCYLLVAGPLKSATVEYHRVVTTNLHIAYLEAEKIILLKSPENVGPSLYGGAIWAGVTKGLKVGSKIYQMLAE